MKIQLEVSDHSWRCIDENKKRCQFLFVRRFGTVWFCNLFSEIGYKGNQKALEERNGCLEKHPKCKEFCEKVKNENTI